MVSRESKVPISVQNNYDRPIKVRVHAKTTNPALNVQEYFASCVSLYAVEGPSTQLRGAATAPQWRNQGIGEALMRAAIAAWWSDTSAPRDLWCNARVAAITLYERLGFIAEGERFEFPQVGPHQRMRWVAP